LKSNKPAINAVLFPLGDCSYHGRQHEQHEQD